jgi:hypothetical protein
MKYYLPFFILILLSCKKTSRSVSSPELLMKKTFGTSNSDFGVDLIQLDHEIYCLGSTTIDDESKIFMVKTDRYQWN